MRFQPDQVAFIEQLLRYYEAAARLYKKLYIGKSELLLKQMQLQQAMFLKPDGVDEELWEMRRRKWKSFQVLPLPAPFVQENMRAIVEKLAHRRWELSALYREVFLLDPTFREMNSRHRDQFIWYTGAAFHKKCTADSPVEWAKRVLEDINGLSATHVLFAKRLSARSVEAGGLMSDWSSSDEEDEMERDAATNGSDSATDTGTSTAAPAAR